MMLYTTALCADESDHTMLVVTLLAMAALVVLAGRLPGDSKLGGDLWPPNAQIDGMVDEHREFRISLIAHVPNVLDLLKHLGFRWARVALRRPRGFRWGLPRPPRLRALHPRTRPVLRLAHGLQDAAQP